MDNEKLNQEINWLKEMAQEGRNSPIAGGIIGIWRGIISFIMMLIHWASITSKIALPIENISWAWLAYMIIGSIGRFVLVKKLEDRLDFNSMTLGLLAQLGCLPALGFSHLRLAVCNCSFWLWRAILDI